MQRKRYNEVIERFSRSRIMVVGDIMLDEYLEGTVDRISPEAPIPVVNLVNRAERDVRLGGAANVLNNLLRLGARHACICGVTGSDADGRLINARLTAAGVDAGGLITDEARPTTIKTRIIAHNQQVIRLDREDRAPASPDIRARMIDFIRQRADHLDAVIFSDYEKGVITPELLAEVLPLLREKRVLVAVDPKFVNFRYFTGVTIMVPNRKEAAGFVRRDIVTDDDALTAAQAIMEQLGCECVLVKLGERGMRFVDRQGSDVVIRTAAEQVFDVTGAGDTVISALVLSRTAGATWEEAARIANVAAGIVIHYIGTTAVDVAQLTRAVMDNKITQP
jgi:D-beta-D-heptose 7-phosphate kinase/D-beta-D-heptose 1-phosphate adenosyltransferase